MKAADDILILSGLIKCITRRRTPAIPSLSSAKSPHPISKEREEDTYRPNLRASKIPSSRVSRLYEFGKLGFNLAVGQMKKVNSSSYDADEKSVQYLVTSLSRMRGAALKIGQMFSISEQENIPTELQQLMVRLQNSADYMPIEQLESVMVKELDDNWKSRFAFFDMVPIAAASIGQVHKAKLTDGTPVAVKVQYPNVAESIASDLNNLSLLLKFSKLLPPGMFLENTIKVAKEELTKETNYLFEADAIERFRFLLKHDIFFRVPKIYRDVSTSKILTTSFMKGVPLGSLFDANQHTRDMVLLHFI